MIRNFIKATVQLLIVLVLLSACASDDTILITDHFEITGRRVPNTSDFSFLYHLGAGGTREHLGSHGGYFHLQDPNKSIGLSLDGSRVVYFHTVGSKSDKPSGIYLYEHGSGDQLLYRSEEIAKGWFWANLPNKPLPDANAIRVVLQNSEYGPTERHTPTIITTDGISYPLVLHLARPLHTAAYYGNADDVRTLLAEGALVDEETYWGNTALEIAIIRGNEEIALQIIESGSNVGKNYRGNIQPIHMASGLPSIKVMDAILSKSVDVNLADTYGRTPIYHAVDGRVPLSFPGVWGAHNFYRNSQPWDRDNIAKREALEYLIGKGAELDTRDTFGENPLDHALLLDQYRTARLLIEAMEEADIPIENIEERRRIVDEEIERWDNKQ